MNVDQDKKHFYLCSLIQTFIFIPFLIQGYIGSDWDSYALIGTVIIMSKILFIYLQGHQGFPYMKFF